MIAPGIHDVERLLCTAGTGRTGIVRSENGQAGTARELVTPSSKAAAPSNGSAYGHQMWRYRCNDIGFNPDFKKLVVSVDLVDESPFDASS